MTISQGTCGSNITGYLRRQYHRVPATTLGGRGGGRGVLHFVLLTRTLQTPPRGLRRSQTWRGFLTWAFGRGRRLARRLDRPSSPLQQEMDWLLGRVNAGYWVGSTPVTGSGQRHLLGQVNTTYWVGSMPLTGSAQCHLLGRVNVTYWVGSTPLTGSGQRHLLGGVNATYWIGSTPLTGSGQR